MGFRIEVDFTGIDAMSVGGAPPEGAYKAKVSAIDEEDGKEGTNIVVGFTVSDGPYAGCGGRAWFPLPNGKRTEKGDSFVRSKLKRFFLAIGVPANAVAAACTMDDSDVLLGRPLVVYVQDQGTRINDRGEEVRKYEFIPVLPEDRAAALKGEWRPAPKDTPAQAAAQTPAPARAQAPTRAPSNGAGQAPARAQAPPPPATAPSFNFDDVP